MNDFNESVIMPREDFVALQNVAFDHSLEVSAGTRAAQLVQTTLALAVLSAAVTAMTWGWAKAADWLNSRDHERTLARLQFQIDKNIVESDSFIR